MRERQTTPDSRSKSRLRPVTSDLVYMREAIVNVLFYGEQNAGDRQWVLIDAGIFTSAGRIQVAAAERFGADARPAAIILTHGHFDHVGALPTLADAWDVPVFAHPLEFPYVSGKASYPPADPLVGGGAMAYISPLYPSGPFDAGSQLHELPSDGSVPGMPGWRWIHTPGHSPGHVALYRDSDRTLIAGDAFVTVRQESLLAVLSQAPEIHRPPAYYTIDWPAAGESVRMLSALEPELVVTGHGVPLAGPDMRAALSDLARNFDELAVPPRGRYVENPATATTDGIVSVPPSPLVQQRTALLAAGAVLGLMALSVARSRRS